MFQHVVARSLIGDPVIGLLGLTTLTNDVPRRIRHPPTVGGGIDLSVNRRLTLRLIQLDGVKSSSGHWGYVRTSFGLVFLLNGVSCK